jgi:hypothetical protein
MASGKKRRKAGRQARKQQLPRTGPFRHPDGDRRHRGGMTYEEGLAIKRKLQQAGAEVPSEEEE